MTTDISFLIWLAPLVALCTGAALWIGISYGISRMGWHAFAARYPAPGEIDARRYFTRAARFGSPFARYRNAVRLAFVPQGIHFSTLFLFRVGHDPFVVPWSSVVHAEQRRGLIGAYYEIEIRDPAGSIRVWLPPSVEELVQQLRGPRRPSQR